MGHQVGHQVGRQQQVGWSISFEKLLGACSSGPAAGTAAAAFFRYERIDPNARQALLGSKPVATARGPLTPP